MENLITRYEFLKSEIEKHDKLYEMECPEIGDSEYDELYFELLTIEKEHPELITEDSPTQKINTELVDSLEKKEHQFPMLSQNKIKTIPEVDKFVNEDVSGDILGQEKLDGLTIVLEYNKGKLDSATTRGNGYIGEVVTHNVKTFKNVPKKISFKGKLILRAEALVLISEFNKLIDNGESYSNPRNLASGTIRQLDSSVCSKRNMVAKVFDLVYIDDMEFTNDVDALEWLRTLGFDIVEYKLFKRTSNIIKDIEEYINNYETKKRKTLEYMIDGLVFKSNNYKERETLGYTNKWPRWATAFKFKSQETTSKLLQVIHQVGKTGQITPVAIFDKVNIEVDIERATLNNYGIIKNLDLKIGDTIVVIRSNDVIPKITTVIKSKRNGTESIIETPSVCPVCGSKTEFIGENLYCTGSNCQAQVKGILKNFASRNAMDIKGLGEETVDDLYEKGYLTKIQDIYQLDRYKTEICEMDGYGEKKYENLQKGIESSKNKELNNLLLALSIRLIGDSTAKNVAKYFKNIDNLINLTKDKDNFFEECKNIDDFGIEKTNSLYMYFTNSNNIEIINFLKAKGINTSIKVVETQENSFIKDKVFVITGDINNWKNRNELKAYIESAGGKVSGSVSKKTNYLINNDVSSTSGKNKTAKDLEIPIISETDFIKLTKGDK